MAFWCRFRLVGQQMNGQPGIALQWGQAPVEQQGAWHSAVGLAAVTEYAMPDALVVAGMACVGSVRLPGDRQSGGVLNNAHPARCAHCRSPCNATCCQMWDTLI